MKVALYIRVSTEDQSTDMQRAELLKFCAAKGLKYEIFEDFYTGKTMDRPEFSSLTERIDEFEAVYIYKVDRLSRRALDAMLIVRDFADAGVKVISLMDPFDLTSASGRLSFNMKAVINQFEVDQISERTKAGLAAVKASGKRLGHEPLTLDIPLIKSQLAAGQRVETIAKRVGLSKSQLYRRLSA
jgi:DNA invertase Pin-like site-specific DNA recombinase